MFKKGDRVVITKDVIGGNRNHAESKMNIKGRFGTIVKPRDDKPLQWKVQIDNDPGYVSQSGCWHVHANEMEKTGTVFNTNENSLSLLIKEDFV